MPSELIIWVIASLVTAFIVSFVCTPVVRQFANRSGIGVDVPKDNRRMHKVPIPRIGGLAIFLGFMISVLVFSEVDSGLRGILIGLVLIVVISLIDDISPLPALLRFAVQIAAAIIVVAHGVRIEFLSNINIFSDQAYLHLGEWISNIVTVIWIVAITNSVNFIDGLDGLAVGVSTISSLCMLIIALLVSEPNIALVMAALVGACAGFMPYNLNPAKIFMGDVGAMSIGFILATISIQGLFKFYAVISFAVPFLILALPIFDEVFAVVRRLLKGQNPMSPDRGHVHHRLIDMGFNQKQAVAIMYTMSGILGLTAVVLTASGEIRAMFLLLAFLLVGFVAWRLIGFGKKNAPSGETEKAEDGSGGAEPDAQTAPDAGTSGEAHGENGETSAGDGDAASSAKEDKGDSESGKD